MISDEILEFLISLGGIDELRLVHQLGEVVKSWEKDDLHHHLKDAMQTAGPFSKKATIWLEFAMQHSLTDAQFVDLFSKAGIERRRGDIDGAAADSRLPDIDNIRDRSILKVLADHGSEPSGGYRYDLFVCHSSKDKEIASELFDLLKANGITCWMDSKHQNQGGVVAGDMLHEKIARAAELSRGAIVLVGAELGGFQRDEIGLLFARSQKGHLSPLVFVPLGPDGKSNLPPLAEGRRYIEIDPSKSLANVDVLEIIESVRRAAGGGGR